MSVPSHRSRTSRASRSQENKVKVALHGKLPPPDPAVLMHKKFLAKCRFRALVRRVMANLYWLTETEEVYEGDNVKRRVEQAMRAKKQRTLLTLKDKALLNKPASQRTEFEKKYIYRKIGGLKCFKRYPNDVKRKLAAATYFRYYGPNRVVVRQNQDAHALYFVVTGEVVVSVLIFDELLQQQMSVNVFVMTPGDMFGEVSLLHNISRTATCTTTGHCEFLALMKEDFKIVLQASLQKQWDEVRKAMAGFTYFDTLDEVARREGCIVAKMKTYDPNETIIGDGVGLSNFVYFVLAGNCQMIETLKVGVTKLRDRKFYSLYDPFVPKSDSDLELHNKYFNNKEPVQGSEKKHQSFSSNATHEVKRAESDAAIHFDKLQPDGAKESTSKHSDTSPESSKKASESDTKLTSPGSIKTQKASERVSEGLNVLKDDALSSKCSAKNYDSSLGIEQRDELECQEPPSNLFTYFMQVCIFKPGSTFGFGENMRDRRIVALTRVDCMLLPKMWLLQRNTANIWSRIQHYLERKIPTKKQLFKEFVNQRRWQESREHLVREIVNRTKTVNYTTIHDVPYSIRMEEMFDI